MSAPEYPVCHHCGSAEVSKDAIASWDHKLQEWVTDSVYDAGYCSACETEQKWFDWKEGTPPEVGL